MTLIRSFLLMVSSSRKIPSASTRLWQEGGASQKRLKILNGGNEAATLHRVFLEKEIASAFNLTLNGQTGKSFSNVKIAAGDSTLVLIDLQPNNDTLSAIALVTDRLIFQTSSSANISSTVLQSWSLSNREYDKGMICNATWDSSQAHIVRDTLVLEAGCTLTVEAGSQILFDQGAALFIQGQVNVLGSPDNPVTFRFVRMDDFFKTAPGQWNGIYFLEGSSNNRIQNTIIENGAIGLRVGTPDEDTLSDLTLENVIIRHQSGFGIQAFNSDINAINLLVYDIGQIPLFHAIGGSYHYQHATIANFPSQLGSQEPASIFADHLLTETEPIIAPLLLKLENSILWSGGAEQDLAVSLLDADNSSIDVNNNIIYSNESIPENIISSSLDFINFVNEFGFDYRLDSLSPAVDMTIDSDLTFDLMGNPRDSVPDIGALEFQK